VFPLINLCLLLCRIIFLKKVENKFGGVKKVLTFALPYRNGVI
jgi:hypothetical protein